MGQVSLGNQLVVSDPTDPEMNLSVLRDDWKQIILLLFQSATGHQIRLFNFSY